jgi:predicted nuclease of restriction endonuclease-like (RecB) superfamily
MKGASMKRTASRQPPIASGISSYAPFLAAVKNRIRAAQVKATFAANAELIHLYWDIGCAIAAMQEKEGWGAGVIPRLARDIANDLPEVKGFSERNLKYMIRFAREYGARPIVQQAVAQLPAPAKVQQPVAQMSGDQFGQPAITQLPISPQAVAKLPDGEIVPQAAAQLAASDDVAILQQLVAQLPWGQNVILLDRVKDLRARRWYVEQTIAHGWSRSALALQISSRAHEQRGKAVHNFHATLPPPQSDLAAQVLKDPYIFDFLTLAEPFRERELELGLLREVEKFLLELGQGFAFVGRQYHLEVGEDEFYLDLLFYHLRLRSFVVVDLKRGPFKAEYAGKMNFYCNVVDDRLRHPDDQPTIGIILCQDKNRIVAEYALKGVKKSIGVSEYQITRALPREFESSLPTVEQMETELARLLAPKKTEPGMTRTRKSPSVKSVVKRKAGKK